MLNDRKLRILRAITEDYISTAEPVGSRTIARKYKLGVSPATIRNEMADLEEVGYLRQPHTSAGRIPSDKGYRMYVDCLMDRASLSAQEREAIRQEISNRAQVVEELIHQTSHLLSVLTQYTALILAPRLSQGIFRHIQLVGLDPATVLVVLVVDPGFVHNKVLQLSSPATPEELSRLASFLNSKLRGLTMEDIGHSLLAEIRREISDERLFDETMGFLQGALEHGPGEKVYTDGAIQVLNHPEFKDIERARVLLQVLEDRDALFNLLSGSGAGSGISVIIGEENKLEDLKECSLITATYSIGGQVVGTIGLLGPTRMKYDRSCAAVEYVASLLSEMLSKVDKRGS